MKNKILASLLAVALFLVGSAASAQQYTVLPSTTNIGVRPNDTATGNYQTISLSGRLRKILTLPNGYGPGLGTAEWGVTSSIIGPDGYTWVAEGRAGGYVAKIAGTSFFEYVTPSNNIISSLTTDGVNIYGIETTGNKLAQITPTGSITEFSIPTASAGVWSICYDGQGNICGSESAAQKIFFFNTTSQTFTEYSVTGIGAYVPRSITAAGGSVWCATSGAYVFSMDASGNETDYVAPSLKTYDAIAADGSGGIWVIAGQELCSLIGGSWKAYTLPLTNPATHVYSFVYANGKLWGTEKYGIFQVDPTTAFADEIITPDLFVANTLTTSVTATNQLFVMDDQGVVTFGDIGGASASDLRRVDGKEVTTGLGTSAQALRVAVSTDSTLPISQGGSLLSATNPLPVGIQFNGAAVSTSNGIPIQWATNQASLPVALYGSNTVYLGSGVNNIGSASIIGSNGFYKANVSSAGALQVDGSAVTQPVSGTVTANAGTGNFSVNLTQFGGTAASATNPVPAQLSVSNAAASAANPVPAQLSQGNAALSQTNALPVTVAPSPKQTFSAAVALVPTAAGDVFQIQGSGTKTIKIVRIRCTITGSASSGSNLPVTVAVNRHSAGNAAGTTTSVSTGLLDTNNAAATATCTAWTTPGTSGTASGTLAELIILPMQQSIYPGLIPFPLFEANAQAQPIVLRGTGDYLVVNVGSIPATPKISVDVLWTEE